MRYRRQRCDEDWQDKEYPVLLDRTQCNYGGERTWFLCPANGCSRRVAILYSGSIFACRHCHNLAYDSQRESPYDRALSRAQDIRMRLGGSGSLADDFPEKPKGMHWRTYNQLCIEAEEAQNQSWAALDFEGARLGGVGSLGLLWGWRKGNHWRMRFAARPFAKSAKGRGTQSVFCTREIESLGHPPAERRGHPPATRMMA